MPLKSLTSIFGRLPDGISLMMITVVCAELTMSGFTTGSPPYFKSRLARRNSSIAEEQTRENMKADNAIFVSFCTFFRADIINNCHGGGAEQSFDVPEIRYNDLSFS